MPLSARAVAADASRCSSDWCDRLPPPACLTVDLSQEEGASNNGADATLPPSVRPLRWVQVPGHLLLPLTPTRSSFLAPLDLSPLDSSDLGHPPQRLPSMAASPQASSSSSVLKRRDSPIISLELDMSSFPSVLDRAFVMGHASPYRRSSAESELDFILEEDFEADSDNELGPQANRGSRSGASERSSASPRTSS